MDVQSEEAVIYQNDSTTQHENVKFSDADAGFSYDLDDYSDPTRMMQDSDAAELGDFFSRPVKIWEQEWSQSLNFGDQINPWKLFFENKRVLNRISNFNLLRCKLKVKILINGTPFHYGRLIASYNPLDVYDEASEKTSLIREELVQFSQRPHIYLNPTNSQGGEMELPFFWHRNYISIPESQWDEMGRLYFRTVNELQHANGASDTVTVSVFAWATDVSLAVPTSVEPRTLVPQAKETKIKATMKGKSSSKPKAGMSAPQEHNEANKSGVISGPATAIAKAAGVLKTIPFLTPYATAAEFAADKTASIAKLFGYSRPAVTRDPEPFKPSMTSSLALTTVPDMSNKMTVDDQQALAIDTRIAGVGTEDTLSIKGIAGREAYLTQFNWTTAETPETLLWNCRVDPCLWAQSGVGNQTAYHFPPCCMAAMPFKYWTGSMKFRFQIVKSAYHKGRIKLVYDPQFFASNEYNVNHLEVIDITDKDDFTVTIGNGQDITLLDHLNPSEDSPFEGYSTTPYAAGGAGNGVLGVYVVNKLTAPTDSGNGIEVNVFISMGDDFEVFVPEHKFMEFTTFPPPPTRTTGPPLDVQSAEEDIPISEVETEPQVAPPLAAEECELGPTLQYEDMINRVWTGESIQSFRPLLKRYCLWSAIATHSATETAIIGRMPNFPAYRGYSSTAMHATNGGTPYSYCNTLLLHWVTLAHQGWRGGIRYKMLPRGQQDYATLYVQRAPEGDFSTDVNYSLTTSTPATQTNAKTTAFQTVKTIAAAGNPSSNAFLGWQGQVYQNSYINPALEFEVPYYSKDRFDPGKKTDLLSNGPKTEKFDFRIFSTTKNTSAYDIFVSAGEDFQVYFWTGLPRMYRETGPPL